ncbi:DUF2207 domain-containing protein [Cognatiluteimonas weifangensis]|uniref:DUF2207 domain-containing protein n=1 Tax=Cognatiluteimonas weifangensis TaxID=2303539 RepID=A0A372DIM9_9GAMM|nr:DUF2207 domain-containing protein [Luteimonas weifangensis]RFP59428.1 DUF2207 domain-containing protein [Luteimonas weifangensis]
MKSLSMKSLLALLWPLALLLPVAIHAQERILAYDSAIAVQADGSLEVTERITVRAEGDRIRRGIYRDFPTRYRDRYGNRVVVDFEMLDVARDGRPEPWFTERKANGVRINTGNDALLPVPADYTYTLRYRTTRQLGFFADHDELYWNAIGTGWAFPIERGTVQLRLPQPVPIAALRAGGFTGAQGATGQAFMASLPAPGSARWQLTQPLAPGEGFTIVLSFPKGLVPAPTRTQRVRWFFRDNRGALLALLGLLVLSGYCLRRWRQLGRDPRPGIIIARYEPPAGHSPAGLRYLRRMGYDTRCFSSDLLALAVAGEVRIQRQDKLLKDAWTLQRQAPATAHATGPQRALLDRLFRGGGDELALASRNATTLQAAQAAHTAALKAQYQPSLFRSNGRSVVAAAAIDAVATALALLASGGAGLPAILACTLLMTAVVIAFARLVKAPTPAGRALLDQIEGLKLYLGVAERDELARLPGPEAAPPLDAERYQRLLPYAVALEVEEAWTRQFTLAVGAAAAAASTAAMTWYSGGRGGDLGSFASAIGSSLSSQIAASSSPPGSSSGSGGSSGGGGGGGGGGGR